MSLYMLHSRNKPDVMKYEGLNPFPPPTTSQSRDTARLSPFEIQGQRVTGFSAYIKTSDPNTHSPHLSYLDTTFKEDLPWINETLFKGSVSPFSSIFCKVGIFQ